MKVYALDAIAHHRDTWNDWDDFVTASVAFLTPPTPDDVIAAMPLALQSLADQLPDGAWFEDDIEWEMRNDVPVFDLIEPTPDHNCHCSSQNVTRFPRQRKPDNFGAAAVGFLIGASL